MKNKLVLAAIGLFCVFGFGTKTEAQCGGYWGGGYWGGGYWGGGYCPPPVYVAPPIYYTPYYTPYVPCPPMPYYRPYCW